MFHVGQRIKCVCVTNSRGRRSAFIRLDGEYTIRAMFRSPLGRLILNLHESRGPLRRNGLEKGFDSRQFRPIVERKTDISIFTAMLTKQTVEA